MFHVVAYQRHYLRWQYFCHWCGFPFSFPFTFTYMCTGFSFMCSSNHMFYAFFVSPCHKPCSFHMSWRVYSHGITWKVQFKVFFSLTVTMFLLGLIQNTPSLKSFTKSHKLWTVFSTDDPRKQQHLHRGGAAVRPTCVGYQDPDRAFQWTCSHCLHAGGACGISLAWWVNLTCFF